ncbi:MAG: hypothetical protein ABWZ67_12645 [Solirubrobacteraceae bacterium]
MTRSGRVSSLVVVLALAEAAPAVAVTPDLPDAPPLRDRDYFALADAIVVGSPARWDEGVYHPSGRSPDTRTNANFLLVHAVAAREGHVGPARADDRALTLAARFTRPPAHLARAPFPPSVCWATRLNTAERDHITLDPQVAEALASAYAARRELDMPRSLARRVRSAVERCAHLPSWRWPSIVLNQLNWNTQLYVAAADVSGHGDLLRRDYRLQLVRFVRGIRTHLGPGYSFRYSPFRPASAPLNLDAPEYATLVASSLGAYEQARAAGMAPIGGKWLLRAWVRRLVAGSWTHAGYLNWDTGYGRQRWNSGQYWALAQHGLLRLATARTFWPGPRYGPWMKAMFDRGLLLFADWARAARDEVAPQRPFGVHARHENHAVYASRIAGNAARAVAAGLGRRPAEDPPPLYAFDPDTRRLAVSTARYSTAIVPNNRGAFAYGGIGPARLFGPGQRPVANVGGRPPCAIGIVVRDAAGTRLVASQDGRPGSLRLTDAPGGTRRRPYSAKPLAGPFDELRAVGSVTGAGVRITAAHRFGPSSITTHWRVDAGGRPVTVDLHLPTWGPSTRVRAERRRGRPVTLRRHGGRALRLEAVRRLRLGRRGYEATVTGAPDGARVRAIPARGQRTNPRPGPTVRVRLAAGRRTGTLRVTTRLRPVGTVR